MNRVLLTSAVVVFSGSLLLSNPTSAQFIPNSRRAAHVRIVKGPELESSRENTTIITWTSNNPGGSPEHLGVVHYGTDPRNLTQTAKSHIRLNQDHPYTVFLVRIEDLPPKITYYYIVVSMDYITNDKYDSVTIHVKNLRTPSTAV